MSAGFGGGAFGACTRFDLVPLQPWIRVLDLHRSVSLLGAKGGEAHVLYGASWEIVLFGGGRRLAEDGPCVHLLLLLLLLFLNILLKWLINMRTQLGLHRRGDLSHLIARIILPQSRWLAQRRLTLPRLGDSLLLQSVICLLLLLIELELLLLFLVHLVIVF